MRRLNGLRIIYEIDVEKKMNKLVKIVSSSNYPVVVTTHKNADPDAVASSYVMANALRRIGVDARLLLPEGVNQVSKRVIENILGSSWEEIVDESPQKAEISIVLDTASLNQLGVLADFVAESLLIVIDHHASSNMLDMAKLDIYSPNARSTSEIVYTLTTYGLGLDLSKRELELIIAGIIYDTRHLILSTPTTLRIVAEILEKGVELNKVARNLQSTKVDISEKIAKMKAVKRLNVLRAGDYIIAITNVNAFESSVARSLIELGADLALVLSQHGSEVRVIGRAKKEISEELSISVGSDIMSKLALKRGGGGGGHTLAAGATVKGNLEEVMKDLLSLVREILEKKGYNVSII